MAMKSSDWDSLAYAAAWICAILNKNKQTNETYTQTSWMCKTMRGQAEGDKKTHGKKKWMKFSRVCLSFISFHNVRSIILPLFFNLKVNEIILGYIKCSTIECTHEPCPEHFLGAPFPALLLNFIYYYYYLLFLSVKSYRPKLCARAESVKPWCDVYECSCVFCNAVELRLQSNQCST